MKYLKYLLFIFLPITIYAEPNYLYDVLKNEAENGGLAKEYIGEHHDSFTREPTDKIYHWYTDNNTDANQVLTRNNVIFGGLCWQMIRTTDTGGVKLLYNGEAVEDKCLNSRPDHVGIFLQSKLSLLRPFYYSTKFVYDKENNKFSLGDDEELIEFNENNKNRIIGKYTCFSDTKYGECQNLRYIASIDENNEALYFDLRPNANYDGFGEASFNLTSSSLADVGYMYNTRYEENSLSASGRVTLASDFTYENGVYKLGSNRKTVNVNYAYNVSSYTNYHYTCLDTSTECENIAFVNYLFNNQIRYILLKDGANISDALTEMLSSRDVNKYDSVIKSAVEAFYQNYLLDYNKYIEETIYCNNRSVYRYSGFAEDGDLNGGSSSSETLLYESGLLEAGEELNLSCENETDRFSISNPIAKSKYSIGLPTLSELYLLNKQNNYSHGYGSYYLMSPRGIWGPSTQAMSVIFNGSFSGYITKSPLSIRPIISLVKGTEYVKGNGSKENPYLVPNYNNIIINNTTHGTIETEKETDVAQNSQVLLRIKPEKGYELHELTIIDINNNSISYQKTNNENEYIFEMPNSNITIDSVFTKVKSSINVEIVNETEDISIELNDITEIEYDEKVKFKITPIKGYKVKSIKILDSNNNEIEYNTTDNTNFVFKMPASDVTIIPSYEKVKNFISVEENIGTKEFVIELNDIEAVIYEEKVKFTISTKEGYELIEINIKDKNNNIVDYTKIKDYEYEFIMPDTSVTITPIYKLVNKIIDTDSTKELNNPDTKDSIIIVITTIILSSIIVLSFLKKKKLSINNKFL